MSSAPQKVQVFALGRPRPGAEKAQRRYYAKWRVDGRDRTRDGAPAVWLERWSIACTRSSQRSSRRRSDRARPKGHPLASATVCDLRHAATTTMLRAAIPPAEVARRLGHSVDVLMRVCARVFDDERERSNQLIDRAKRRATL